MRTKYAILEARLKEASKVYNQLVDQIESLNKTPFNQEGWTAGKCGTCSLPFLTEADFANHYVIPDERYLNIGECPTKDNNAKYSNTDQLADVTYTCQACKGTVKLVDQPDHVDSDCKTHVCVRADSIEVAECLDDRPTPSTWHAHTGDSNLTPDELLEMAYQLNKMLKIHRNAYPLGEVLNSEIVSWLLETFEDWKSWADGILAQDEKAAHVLNFELNRHQKRLAPRYRFSDTDVVKQIIENGVF